MIGGLLVIKGRIGIYTEISSNLTNSDFYSTIN